jgi:hypothetical protein
LLYRPFWAGYPIMAKKYNQGNKKVHFNFKEVDLFEVIIFLVITIVFSQIIFLLLLEFYFISIVKAIMLIYLWSFCLAVSYADS